MAASMSKFSCRHSTRFFAVTARQNWSVPFAAGQDVRYLADAQVGERKDDVSAPEIVVPNRIVRSPTAVLEILASVAGRDNLAPDYNFIDDPYLIPTSNMQKRNYNLAKGSGRKAAQWAIENFPGAFENELIAEPRVDAFMPTISTARVLEESGETVESLKTLIENQQGEPAWELYTKLSSENTEIPKEVQQQLLELLCFYNGKNKPQDHTPEEIRYQKDVRIQYHVNKRTQKRTWQTDGSAMQLFEQMKDKDSSAYNAVIQGMCKHGATEDVQDLYNNMIDQNLKVEEQTICALISCVSGINEDHETRWDMIKRYLKDMQVMEIAPNVKIFNSILSTVLSFGRWRHNRTITREVLGEMKACEIEPSLGTWALVVRMFYYTDAQTSMILHDIVAHIQQHGRYTFEDMYDFDFFSVAMNKTCTNLRDAELARRVDDVLNSNDNARFIGDVMKEGQYYNQYLKLLCTVEDLEVIMDVYDRCTPHIFTPNISCLVELLNALELYDGHRFLPQIWSDLILFDYTRRDDLMEPLFQLMASRKHEADVQQNCHHAVSQIRKMIEDGLESQRPFVPVLLSGSVMSNWIRISLYSDDLDSAVYFYDLYNAKSHSLPGVPSPEALSELALALVHANDADRFMRLVHSMSESGYPVSELVEKGTQSLALSDSQSHRLSMMS